MAARPDGAAVRRDEEEQGRHGGAASRGRLRARPVHGGRALGHADGHDRRVAPQGAHTPDARHLHQGDPRRPDGRAQRLRVPRLQDEAARSDVRLDVQPEEQGEAGQVDHGRRRAPAADLAAADRQLWPRRWVHHGATALM